MPRFPASSKASAAVSPSVATFPRASCGQLAGTAATSCASPSRARAEELVAGHLRQPEVDDLQHLGDDDAVVELDVAVKHAAFVEGGQAHQELVRPEPRGSASARRGPGHCERAARP